MGEKGMKKGAKAILLLFSLYWMTFSISQTHTLPLFASTSTVCPFDYTLMIDFLSFMHLKENTPYDLGFLLKSRIF